MPTVSVVIPTYNRANVLGSAIRSVLNQDYQDFEIIVVDDGSTDDTEQVVTAVDKPQIKYIRHEENRGPAAARNTGIGSARGRYIAFQDSDDQWVPQKLGHQVQVIEAASGRVGAVYTGFWRVKNGNKTYEPRRREKSEGDIHKELLRGNFLGTPTILVKRECFGSAGLFDEKLFHLEDWEAWLRISRHYEFRLIDEGLVECFETPDSLSTNLSTLIEAHEYILGKHHEMFRTYPEIHGEERYWIGNLWCQFGDGVRGRQYFRKALKATPLNPKYVAAYLLSFLNAKAYRGVRKFMQKAIGDGRSAY
jgi:glycosyltransferase involved in cell wall biosynthesis